MSAEAMRASRAAAVDAFPRAASRAGREWAGIALAFAAIYVVWGSTYLAIAVAVETIPPLLMMGVRSVLAGMILYAGARATGAGAPTAADWRAAARVGVLFFVAGHGLLAWSETRVASGVAAVLIATEPLFIVLLGWAGGRLVARRRGERPRPLVLAALAIGMGGVAVMTLPGARGAIDPLGAAGLVLASFAWSVGTFHVPRGGCPFRAAGMQLLTGGGMLLLVSLLLGELHGWSLPAVRRESLLALGYLVVVGSVITFGAYIWLLSRVSAERVASHTYVNPVIAVALGSLVGQEVLDARVLVATLMVLTAVLLLRQRPRQRT